MRYKAFIITTILMVCAWSQQLFAQKDVTSTYIINATLSNGTNGWTVSNFNSPQRGNNTTGYASEAYAGWGALEKTSYSLTQTITLPAGNYTLVNYSFFRQGQTATANPSKSLAYLKAGDRQVPIKTLGSISAPSYANSQSEAANVFDTKMYRNTLDLTIDADGTQIEIGLVGTFDEMKSWCIAGMFELIDNNTPATMDSPFDVTGYITNPGFEYRDMSGWTVSPTRFFDTQSNNQGFKVGGYYTEKWQNSNLGALPEGSMSQTISNLPAGYYKLTANIGGNGTYIALNSNTTSWTADGDHTVDYELAEGEDLTITAGKTAEGTANWIHFDNFKLYYCGKLPKPAIYSTTIEDGVDYWIYNAATGKFLGGANSWGTRSSLIEHGIPFKTNKVAENVFTLDSYTSNGGNSHFLWGEMIDGNAEIITILPNDNGTFSLCFSDLYLKAKSSNTEVDLSSADLNDPYAQWYFLSQDDLEKTLFEASKDNPVDATFYIKDYNFSRNNTFYTAWDKYNISLGGDNTNYCVESYHETFTMSQTLTIPNGTYKLSVQGFYRQDGSDNTNFPVFFANDQEKTFPIQTGTEKTMSDCSISFSNGMYKIDPIIVNVINNTLIIGARNDINPSLWCCWDNFELEYIGRGNDINFWLDAYNKTIMEARELMTTTETISHKVVETLQQVVATYDENHVDKNSLDVLMNAVKMLSEANVLAKTSIASYKTIENGVIPTDNIAGWKCTNTQQFDVNTWSTEGTKDGSGMTTPFIHNWINSNFVLNDGIIYYTLAGLEPGETFYVEALVRVYNESGILPNGPKFFVNSFESNITTGTAFEYNGMKGYYGTFGGEVSIGEDGLLTIGVEIDNANYNWVCIKDVKIHAYSDNDRKEAYAVQDIEGDGATLTFYYDDMKEQRIEENFEVSDIYLNETYAYWWRSSISKVVIDKSFEEARPKSTAYWFYNLYNAMSFEGLEYLNTSEVVDMSYMFGIPEPGMWIPAKKIDVSHFDTSKVTNMEGMFMGLGAIESIDLNNFETSNVTNMSRMFACCGSLKNIDLSSFNTSKVANMSGMFGYPGQYGGCYKLKNIIWGDFDTSNVTNMDCMFKNCTSLEELDLSCFNTSKVEQRYSTIFYIEDQPYLTSSLKKLHISPSMGNLGDNTWISIGTPASPCRIYAPDGFDFGVDTSGSYFQWKGGYFTLDDAFLLGDVNADGAVTLSDGVCVASWLLEEEPPVFVERAADYNQDEVVTMSDGVAIIQYAISVIMPDEPDEEIGKILDSLQGCRQRPDGFDLQLGALSDITALMMDVTLPEGVALTSATLDGTHSVVVKQMGHNRYRIAAWSMDLATVGHGAVLRCTTSGGQATNMSIDHIRLVDRRTREYGARPVEITPTGILEVESTTSTAPRYTLDGKRLGGTPRGIYIQNGKKIIQNKY